VYTFGVVHIHDFLCISPPFTSGLVWIIGDSIIRRAERRLGLPIKIEWKGKGGAGVCAFHDLLAGLSKGGPPPQLLIIHLGTNDLVTKDEYALRQIIAVMLRDCAMMYPNTWLVWSDILPRVFYIGARSQPAIERKRRTVNRWARSQCAAVQAFCMHHPQFVWSQTSLFSYDGVHLSPMGNQLFVANLRQCIVSQFGL